MSIKKKTIAVSFYSDQKDALLNLLKEHGLLGEIFDYCNAELHSLRPVPISTNAPIQVFWNKELLGKGKFSTVRNAFVMINGDEHALCAKKIILRQDQTTILARKEFEILSKLSHPGIPQAYFSVLGYGKSEKHAVRKMCLFLEKAPGVSVAAYINTLNKTEVITQRFDTLSGTSDHSTNYYKMRFTLVTNIAAQLIDTMAYLHSKGIVHRDLKPANIMIDPKDLANPVVKLIDFGFACDANARQLQIPGIGSPLYLCPESQFSTGITTGALDKKLDVWAFGMVLLELLMPSHSQDTLETWLELIYAEHIKNMQPIQKQNFWISILQSFVSEQKAYFSKNFPNIKSCFLFDIISNCLQSSSFRPSFEELKQKFAHV